MKYSIQHSLLNWTPLHLGILLLWSLTAQAENFPIQIGSTISLNSPAPGAGNIPDPNATDTYTFTATAGQLIFIEELAVAPAFQGWLQWKVVTPGGATVFNSFFNGQPKGRKALPETGTYTITVWVGAKNPAYVGNYSFRLSPIPPDHSFAVQIGDTLGAGIPGIGAGHIEVPGAQDLYTFNATAGESAFFEYLTVDSAFRGWLTWELRAPSNLLLFRNYLGNGQVGRVRLPETGAYRLRVWVETPEPDYIGTYSLRLGRVLLEDVIPIQVGTSVSKGVPQAGAGDLESPGSEDRYVLSGIAGQEVFLEPLAIPASFGGWLKWELKSPSGKLVFSTFANKLITRTLEETGPYSLRFYVGINDPSLIGSYSFRTWCEVFAQADSLAASPGAEREVPLASLLCNDSSGVGDQPVIELLSETSIAGASIARSGDHLLYRPAAGFAGVDRFQYRLRGIFGGSSTTEVRVAVEPGHATQAVVVSLSRDAEGGASACLLGAPDTTYAVDEATAFGTWTYSHSIRTDAEGKVSFRYLPGQEAQRFYRFRKN